MRPHPNFGTVEIRVMDSQTRVEHTLAIAALIQAMVKELAEHYEAGGSLSRYPYEMLDENKWLAARHGLEGELVDLPVTDRVGAPELTKRLMERLRPHAEQLGSVVEFDGLRTSWTTARAPPGRRSSTRRTTISRRWCARSWRPACPRPPRPSATDPSGRVL